MLGGEGCRTFVTVDRPAGWVEHPPIFAYDPESNNYYPVTPDVSHLKPEQLGGTVSRYAA